MKNVLITYHSKHGTTKKYGEEIAAFLQGKGISATAKPIAECIPSDINGADSVLFGCWTHGLMIMLQHPEKTWVDFAKGIPALKNKPIGLFTTYKLATGSMFRKMNGALREKGGTVGVELKSRNGRLSDSDRDLLSRFIA